MTRMRSAVMRVLTAPLRGVRDLPAVRRVSFHANRIRAGLDFHFFRPDEMAESLRAAGFQIEDLIEREPYPDVEHPSQRCYLFARRG